MNLKDRAAKALDETHAIAKGIVASNVPSDDLTFLRARAYLSAWLDGANPMPSARQVDGFINDLERAIRDNQRREHKALRVRTQT